MSCKHGNWAPCELCDELDASYNSGYEAAKNESTPTQAAGGEAPRTCDGKEQGAFEAWARANRYDMGQHPMFYLFLDTATAGARDGWKAGLNYAVAQMSAAAPAAAVEPIFYNSEHRTAMNRAAAAPEGPAHSWKEEQARFFSMRVEDIPDSQYDKAAAAPEGLTGWNLLTPEGNIAATEATCVRAWARIDGYKPTVEGLLGYEEQGWRVVPATPDAKTAEERKPLTVAGTAWENGRKVNVVHVSDGKGGYSIEYESTVRRIEKAHGIGGQP